MHVNDRHHTSLLFNRVILTAAAGFQRHPGPSTEAHRANY